MAWISNYIPHKQWMWFLIHALLSVNSSPPGQNGRHFADDIFRCIWVNESFVFWLKFHWGLLLWAQFTIPIIGLDNGLTPNRRQVIIWTNVDQIHWRMYAALGGDELNHVSKRGPKWKMYRFTWWHRRWLSQYCKITYTHDMYIYNYIWY